MRTSQRWGLRFLTVAPAIAVLVAEPLAGLVLALLHANVVQLAPARVIEW